MNTTGIKHWILVVLAIMPITGCGNIMAVKNDINSPFYYIRPDSKLILHQDVSIAAGRAHASFQHGTVVPGLDNYTVGCVLEVRKLGPGMVSAGAFTITRAESPQEWISRPNIMKFSRVMHLQSASQPDVLRLTCKDWDGPLLGKNISVPEMREALGSIASFEFAK